MLIHFDRMVWCHVLLSAVLCLCHVVCLCVYDERPFMLCANWIFLLFSFGSMELICWVESRMNGRIVSANNGFAFHKVKLSKLINVHNKWTRIHNAKSIYCDFSGGSGEGGRSKTERMSTRNIQCVHSSVSRKYMFKCSDIYNLHTYFWTSRS